MTLASVNHATMHEMNTALVLNTLRLHAPISRAEIAARSGLNKTTVSSIIRTLLDNHFVLETGASLSTEVGRPSVSLVLDSQAGTILSGELGVGSISVVATNFALEIITRRYERVQHLHTLDACLRRIIELFKEIQAEAQVTGRPIFGLSLGVPGLVSADGTLVFAPNLGWRDVSIKPMLEQTFDLPYIFVENEANLAAQGETYLGPYCNSTSLICVVADMGIGGGLMLKHQLEMGIGGFAGEIGHMTIVPVGGERCNCGNTGCWETVAAESAVFRRVERAIEGGQASLLQDMTGGDMAHLSIPLIVQAAEQGDRLACACLEETGRWLGIGIANLVNIFNPEYVILAGSLALAHAFLMPVILDVARQHAMSRPWSQTTIAISEHSADATVMGGAARIHNAVIQNPSQWLVATPTHPAVSAKRAKPRTPAPD